MHSYDVPDCVVQYITDRDLVAADYYLFGSGRALGWVKRAADALDDLYAEAIFEQQHAEYHAYAGISAARTCLDALANWLSQVLTIRGPGLAVDFAKERFRREISEKSPAYVELLPRLDSLARSIDVDRQRAQHREGLALTHYSDQGRSLGWFICTPGLENRHAATLLRGWAAELEDSLCALIMRVQSSLSVTDALNGENHEQEDAP